MEVADYLGNRYASNHIVRRIEQHYRLRGYLNVRAWVEPVPGVPDTYQVRSNLKFRVPEVM